VSLERNVTSHWSQLRCSTVDLEAERRPGNCCLSRRRCSDSYCCRCELFLLLSSEGFVDCWTLGYQYRELHIFAQCVVRIIVYSWHKSGR